MRTRNIFLFLFLFSLVSYSANFKVPEKCQDVMLQGFYWDSFLEDGDPLKYGNDYGQITWNNLKAQATELSANFDMIWLPPSGKGAYFAGVGTTLDVGYHGRYWSDQTSAWGYDYELKTLIAELKKGGCEAIADIVVNHRYGLGDDLSQSGGKTNFCNFATDNFGEFGTYQLTTADICPDDDIYPTSNGCKATGNPDTGSRWDLCPDLDHTSPNVQNSIKAYLKWLKKEIGYSGWRYDFAWGFGGQYLGDYNDASQPSFSVAEMWVEWDNEVETWLKATNFRSSVFDFPAKLRTIKRGIQEKSYNEMAFKDDKGKTHPTELLKRGYARYLVNFVDNHDTFKEGTRFTGNIPQANAFILAIPGVPCVIWPHWVTYKTEISNMIAIRKSMGIHSESACEVTYAKWNEYYESITTGTKGSLICRIGDSFPQVAPDGYELACNGTGWAYYIKASTNLNLVVNPAQSDYYPNGTTVTMTVTGDNAPFIIYYTLDGSIPTELSAQYSSPIKINSSTTVKALAKDAKGNKSIIKEVKYTVAQKPVNLTIRFKKPENWGDKVNVWTWVEGSDVKYSGNEWPGNLAVNEGNDIYSFTSPQGALDFSIIFNNGNPDNDKRQTDDLRVTNSICIEVGNSRIDNQRLIYTPVTNADCFNVTKLEKEINNSQLTAFPNPTDGIFRISSQDVKKVFVSSLTGQFLPVEVVNGQVDITHFPAGIYLVKIYADSISNTIKLIKK